MMSRTVMTPADRTGLATTCPACHAPAGDNGTGNGHPCGPDRMDQCAEENGVTALACAGETYIDHGRPEAEDGCEFWAQCNDWPVSCGWRVDLDRDPWAAALVHRSDTDSAFTRLHAEHVAFSAAKAGWQP